MDHPVVSAVRKFVDSEVCPVAAALEHDDAYPHDLVARMRELGLFGSLVPAAYGGLGLSVATYARVIEELCRGWMSLAGVINSHTMAALIVLTSWVILAGSAKTKPILLMSLCLEPLGV